MNSGARRAAILVVAVALHASAHAADPATATSVAIRGLVERPTSYSVEALSRLPMREVRQSREGGEVRVWRGVLLRDLIAAARPIETGRFDLRQSIVVARATDGYLAVFSWAELFISPIGDQVLIAIERDGALLPDDEKSFALLSGGDNRSGPRHVRWLESVELRRVPP